MTTGTIPCPMRLTWRLWFSAVADLRRSRLEELACYERALRAIGALTDELDHIAEASERSRQWLMKHLSPAQLNDFTRSCFFDVRGGTSKMLYRITWGCSMNIVMLDIWGKPTPRRMCFGPRQVPTFDVMLAQKWALESNEVEALRVAHYLRATPIERIEL
jgi:hypothetical protein